MAHTRTWNAAYEASPANTQDANLGATRIRELKLDVKERLALDHVMDETDDDGYHKQVTLEAQGVAPGNLAGKFRLYSKDIGAGVIELFAKDAAGNEAQLTDAGGITVSATKVTGVLAVANGGSGVTTKTGTGNLVLSASPTFSGTASFGTITASGDGTFNTSDRRLKYEIEKIEYAVDKVECLNGYTFNTRTSTKRQTGLIAQEVLAVLPEAVREDKDGMLGVAYGNVVGLLVEAIKELNGRIKDLENELLG